MFRFSHVRQEIDVFWKDLRDFKRCMFNNKPYVLIAK